MNALVAGLERSGCLAEAECMNAELVGNVPEREARSVHGFEGARRTRHPFRGWNG